MLAYHRQLSSVKLASFEQQKQGPRPEKQIDQGKKPGNDNNKKKRKEELERTRQKKEAKDNSVVAPVIGERESRGSLSLNTKILNNKLILAVHDSVEKVNIL